MKVNGANVVKADVEASNGVIHVIDSVILPQQSSHEPLTRPRGRHSAGVRFFFSTVAPRLARFWRRVR